MQCFTKITRQNEGATAIEFAFVAPVLFLLLFGIIEFSLFMFASSVVEGATYNAARLSRTGAERATGGTANERAQMDTARLKEMILERGSGVLKEDNLNVVASPARSASGTMGEGGEQVVYEVTYNWKILTPFIGKFFSDDSMVSIVSTVVVVNEPFDDDPPQNGL